MIFLRAAGAKFLKYCVPYITPNVLECHRKPTVKSEKASPGPDPKKPFPDPKNTDFGKKKVKFAGPKNIFLGPPQAPKSLKNPGYKDDGFL